jgi:hypothetical protein
VLRRSKFERHRRRIFDNIVRLQSDLHVLDSTFLGPFSYDHTFRSLCAGRNKVVIQYCTTSIKSKKSGIGDLKDNSARYWAKVNAR